MDGKHPEKTQHISSRSISFARLHYLRRQVVMTHFFTPHKGYPRSKVAHDLHYFIECDFETGPFPKSNLELRS